LPKLGCHGSIGLNLGLPYGTSIVAITPLGIDKAKREAYMRDYMKAYQRRKRGQ
jgi:hypothetical protein